MDRLDKVSIAVVVMLLLAAGVLLQGRTPAPKLAVAKQQLAAAADPAAAAEVENNSRIIRNLLESGDVVQAENLIKDLQQKYPYQAGPHMLMGDLLMRRQDPVLAMHAYKKAIDLNPDYLDKKTPLFQGKKLKTAVTEALAEIEIRLKKNPADESLKREKKDVYYLYRKIAGSCG
jgi:tetratricopeptide (TPR) repeat protein